MKLKLKSNKVKELIRLLNDNNLDTESAILEYKIVEDIREPDEYWVEVYVNAERNRIPQPPAPPKSRIFREGQMPPKPKGYK